MTGCFSRNHGPICRAILALCVVAAAGLGQVLDEPEDVVKNGGFEVDADADGLPDHWALRHRETGARLPSPLRPESFCVQLRTDVEEPMPLWMQTGLDLAPGTEYVVSYSARCDEGKQYRVYVEWWKTDGAYGGSTCGKANWQTGSGEWEARMFAFAFPTGMKPPYVVLQLTGPGAVQFDDLRLHQPVREPPKPGTLFSSSFEGTPASWLLDPGAAVQRGDAHDGEAALRLTSRKQGRDVRAVYAGIPTEAGARYRLTYAVKSGGGSTEVTGFQYFRLSTSWQKLVRDGRDFGSVTQKDGWSWQDCFGNWQRRSLEFTAPAKPTAGMTLTCAVRGPGTVFIDDIAVTPVQVVATPDSGFQVALTQPSYRDAVYATRPVTTIKGGITITNPAVSALELTFGEAGKAPAHSEVLRSAASQIAFAVPAATLAEGEYDLRVTAVSDSGTKVGAVSTRIRRLAPAAVEVTVREDNVLLVNGDPFFAIGLWHCPVAERALHQVSSAGFNLIRGSLTRASLDLFARLDLKMMGTVSPEAPDSDAARTAWEETTRAKLAEFRDHPALLGYYLVDEPLWCGRPLQPIIDSYQFHRRLDPYRPIWINMAPRGTVADLAKYNRACDITGVDIYPVPEGGSHSEMDDKTLSSVGKYTVKMRESVEDRKPVWMTLQGFAWKHLSERKAADAIYPDWTQSRFMAYNAVMHGATGIMYWGTHYIAEPEFWDTLCRTAGELRDMSRVFVSPTAQPSSVRTDTAQIALLHKRCGSNHYLIAANEGETGREATFSLPFGVDKLYVLFEQRSVAVKAGSFSDRFAPKDVHVYSDSPHPPAPLVPPPSSAHTPDGETLQERVRVFRDTESYEGKANWIWFPGKSRVANAACLLRRVFELPAAPRHAVVTFAADDACTLFINGHELAQAESWSQARRIVITDRLNEGRNVFAAKASDEGIPPCAFLLDATITGGDGKELSIVSDADWDVCEKEEPGWQSAGPNSGTWVQAEVVAPYGSGAWGKRVTIPPEPPE